MLLVSGCRVRCSLVAPALTFTTMIAVKATDDYRSLTGEQKTFST